MRLQIYVLGITVKWALSVFITLCLFVLALQYFQSLNRLSDFVDRNALIVKYTLMQSPFIVLELFPIATFATIIFSAQQLTRSYESISIRASGLSFWRMSALPLLLFFLLAFAEVFLLRPQALKLYQLSEKSLQDVQGASRVLGVEPHQEGPWFAQRFFDGVALYSLEDFQGQQASNVRIFRFDKQNAVFDRIDAKVMQLKPDSLVLRDAKRYVPQESMKSSPKVVLPFPFKAQAPQAEGFPLYSAVSFWQLPALIERLESQGQDSKRFKVEWHKALSMPLFYLLVVLVGYAVVGVNPRRAGYGVQLGLGFIAVVVIFSFSEFISALGATNLLPSVLAVWGPILIVILLLLNYLLRREDG